MRQYDKMVANMGDYHSYNKELRDDFVSIEVELSDCFNDQIITLSERNTFTANYSELYYKAKELLYKLKLFRIEPSDAFLRFICDFENIERIIKAHNDHAVQKILENNKSFFDNCLRYPLDMQQRRSIVSEEDNCLVVSSAGSGKTSSIIGKIKYLTEIKGVDPQKILLISYTNKAAAELTERLSTPKLRGYTFHKLAIDLIGQVTGKKPSICDNSDLLFIQAYNSRCQENDFKKSIIKYFSDYQIDYATSDAEKQIDERRDSLSSQKKSYIQAVCPDMDGHVIFVKSVQERQICFALFSLGIRFRYEEPYEYSLEDETHSQYRPDFSIYYDQPDGQVKRIYLEHFGVNDRGQVPLWFAEDKNISYEEANQKYNDGVAWKMAVHEKFGTKMISTSSSDFYNSANIKETLRKLLNDVGVPLREKSDVELYEFLMPKNGKQEKAFVRLAATFITLAKSSGKSINDLVRMAEGAGDEKGVFLIRQIFAPIYDTYHKALSRSGQIDFVDLILKATEICRSSCPVECSHIIVDEFQDISIDRYNFLIALRNNKHQPPAKLYCVGDDWQSIYRFSGSDMALFNRFHDYFGPTEICKIETTYRFGEPLVSLSSKFIQRNSSQIQKQVRPSCALTQTDLTFVEYEKNNYCQTIASVISQIPSDCSVFLLGRYSFDDFYLSSHFKSMKKGSKFYYLIAWREIEFLTVHKSKGLEADYVVLLQCNAGVYGFPSLINDDYVLRYVLTENDQFPYGEERRLFYVAITRAKRKTIVLYDSQHPSIFVCEFLYPERMTEVGYSRHPNASKRWTKREDETVRTLFKKGESIRQISEKLGRSQTAIAMRLEKLGIRKIKKH